ncbi:hypothetical protein BGX29_010684 [Mortierella sp. GBA35]|nr:hypothetical protein BGX29_010684 [Mortierella sp. GBA35]
MRVRHSFFQSRSFCVVAAADTVGLLLVIVVEVIPVIVGCSVAAAFVDGTDDVAVVMAPAKRDLSPESEAEEYDNGDSGDNDGKEDDDNREEEPSDDDSTTLPFVDAWFVGMYLLAYSDILNVELAENVVGNLERQTRENVHGHEQAEFWLSVGRLVVVTGEAL